MKVYIFADQEGVACNFSRREGLGQVQAYETLELVSICEAILAHGVDEILLNTIHIVDYERFPKQVRIFHGLPTHDFFTSGLDSSFDAAFITGMHEMAGLTEKGCWRHTILPHPLSLHYSSVGAAWLNGRLVGETGLFAAFAGLHNVPVVLFTGDHYGCLEAADLIPNIETVAVKKAMSFFSAISKTPQVAAEEAAAGAVRALGKFKKIKPLKMKGPATLRVRYLFVERATDAVTAVPGAKRVDEKTVEVTHRNLAALRDNLGDIYAPEIELFQQDTGFKRTTGLFTRLGSEPYYSKPTYTLK